MAPIQLELGDSFINSIGMVMVPIPAGEFQMGSPDQTVRRDAVGESRRTERPQHLVKITKPFYLSIYEVTQQQYEKVMGTRRWAGWPFTQEGPDYPAEWLFKSAAVKFCRKLSEKEGVKYHLPTEAQWEYACRAGTTTDYSFGDDVTQLEKYAWYNKSALVETFKFEGHAHRVGQKLPNPWGLYDMHGNVWEWCQDWYAPYSSEKVVTDPTGPAQGEHLVIRGGAFNHYAKNARSAYRSNIPVEPSGPYAVGFRVARTYP